MHNLISEAQALILAARNSRRIKRILREIDAPRNQAIREARISAQQYFELMEKQ